MSFYTNKQPAGERKLRGGYYTPPGLARYLIDWGLNAGARRILEPSCGDGNFVIAALEHLQGSSGANATMLTDIIAVEMNSTESQKAKSRAERIGLHGAKIEWISQDFFEAYSRLALEQKFDLIVGNPPFIRFQHFEDHSRELAFSHLRKAGYRPTKLANSWAAFVELSIELLERGGRLAMVVPAELLQVNYACELRHRLATQFQHILIIGFKRLVFPEIQQEVLLLLASGKREPSSNLSDIHTLELLDGAELLNTDNLDDTVAHVPTKHSRNGMKWTSLFIDETAFVALDQAEKVVGLTPLGKLAKVDVGIVTGRNSFFIITEDQRNDLQVSSLTVPVLGRTNALKSVVFDKCDFERYKMQYPCFLLDLNGSDFNSFPQSLKDYIRSGEQEEIQLGYKCRIRKRWFDVPSIYTPDAFLFRQIHRYPLLVVNRANATSTDTIHRVRVRDGIDTLKLTAVFFNSVTLAWAEVCGRSYGGGVLELEPSEAEELPIPYSDDINIDTEKVETLLRRGLPYDALDYVDSIVLRGYLGFDSTALRGIRRAWEQLRDRRISRKLRSPSLAQRNIPSCLPMLM